MKARVLVSLLTVVTLLAACGAGGTGPNTDRFANARTDSCGSISGLAALYWDYMNGVIRADYPETIRQVPFNIGGAVTNPVQPLYSLLYPAGWTANVIVNPSLQQTGLHVFRQDGHALWHRRNETVAGTFSSAQVVQSVVNSFHADMSPGSAINIVCSADSTPGALALDMSARIVRFGNYTANITAQTAYLGGLTTAFVQVALAPTSDFGGVAYNVFFPLTAQMGPGGGSGTPECNDGIDNDGDGRVDYPDDPQCSSPLDDSES